MFEFHVGLRSFVAMIPLFVDATIGFYVGLHHLARKR
jgi:hypothetical protein